MLPASLCAKIMVFRRITRIIEVVLNERAVSLDSVSVTSVRILNNSFLWRFPLQIEVLIHLLSCYRLFGNGYCFHLYTLKGIPIKHFAHKGSGHGRTFVC